MSDDSKTRSDDHDAPMKNPDVKIRVKPANAPTKEERHSNQNVADKVRKNLTEKVKEAVKDNESGGKRKQLDAVKKAGADAAKQINPRHVEHIKVDVAGNESSHRPSEGTPPMPSEKK